VHVFLHFGTFGLEVLQLILASKLSELEQFEGFAAYNQFGKQRSESDTKIKLLPLPSVENVFVGGVRLSWE